MGSVSEPIDEAFGAFVEARYRAFVRTAYLLTGDRGHAEDLTQQALLRVYEAMRRGAEPDSLEAYTRSTMMRLATRWRTTRWRQERPAPASDLAETPDQDLPLQVRSALMALPVDQRAVVVLRYYEGLSEQETAAALSVPVGTIKSRMSRAMAALRTSDLLAAPDAEEESHAAT